MKQNRGFSLIELLVVIGIIGVLVALIMPAIASTRGRAYTVSCLNNMKQLAIAALMYADDHDEIIPDVPDTASYIDDEDVYICPRDTRLGLGITIPSSYTASVYTPDSLLPTALEESKSLLLLPSETILYIESNEWATTPAERDTIERGNIEYRHDGRTVVVFADAHVISYTQEQLESLVMPFIREEPR